jgi:N-acetylmuramoyl-L-alanine amidase
MRRFCEIIQSREKGFWLMGRVMVLWAFVSSAQANPRIEIDPGFGGAENGVQAGKEVEKDWNLKFALSLEKAFLAAGFEVGLTRDKDATIDLEKRAQLINTSGAPLAIVIHADRDERNSQQGSYLVLEPPNHSDEMSPDEMRSWGVVTASQYRSSTRLARSIAQRLGINPDFAILSDSRGLSGETPAARGRVLCAPHQSLRDLTIPAVVIDPLFLTSPDDLKKFSDSTVLTDFCQKIVRGVGDYLQIPGE